MDRWVDNAAFIRRAFGLLKWKKPLLISTIGEKNLVNSADNDTILMIMTSSSVLYMFGCVCGVLGKREGRRLNLGQHWRDTNLALRY